VSYRPVRPTFTEPTLIRRGGTALQLWGDDESGEVADAIYISNEKIHLMVFTMPPGKGFTHSSTYRTVFDADELYYVLDGELLMNNPETGEVQLARPGEAVFFRSDTWHHGFSNGPERTRVLEFIAPGPLSGNTQAYARTRPALAETRTADERWLGQWPMAREQARAEASLHLLTDRDVLWTLEGSERVLVGLWLSTDRLTVGTIRLLPGQRSDVRQHAGDECAFVLSGEAGIRLPENEGPRWFELEQEDALYIPAGTPHRYQSFSDEPATLFFVVAPPPA
jgi:quercetin dioxygenase-like cupin family protein